jgi:hypothetical protein
VTIAGPRRQRAAGVAGALLAALALSAPALATGRARPRSAVSVRADGAAPGRTYPVRKLIWGPVSMPSGRSAFPIYHRLGVQVFQIDLNWADTAPTQPADPTNPEDPAYRWPSEIASAVRQAARDHISICLLVHATPAWANGGRSSAWAPTDAASYGQFLTAAARRYPSVQQWMIWGEPNRPGNFEPMPANSPVGPRRYALLLAAGYHALKAVSRRNTVIGGDTWSFGPVEPADFVRWMRLPDGKAPPLDDYGHNPFSRRFPDLAERPYFPGGRDINDIDTLETQLHGIYHRRVPLWLSEFTISSNHRTRAFNFAVSDAGQARWLTAAYHLASSVPYVAGLGWFNLIDQSPPTRTSLTNGLLTYDGRPKPAYRAYMHAR